MAVRLITLWRGEIALPKSFWFFGIIPLLLFSFTFISSQTIMASIVGRASNAVLYFDYLLMAIYVLFGIFILVAIWRSANKYQGLRRWSYLAKVGGIVIVLWFIANLGLYVFIKTFIPPAIEAKIDYVPEKLKLPITYVEADSLYLKNFQLKFPFYKEDIRHTFPSFFEHQLMAISISLDRKGRISFHEILGSLPETKLSITDRVGNWLLNQENSVSYIKMMRQVHNSCLKEYSWWNLRNNLRLATNLILKLISIPSFDSKVYYVETPHLSGYLRNGHTKNNHIYINYEFEVKEKSYSLSIMTTDEKVASKFMNILSTIQPVGDIDKGYDEMQAQYRLKDKSKYPEELLLLSLISLKGATADNLNDVLRIEEKIHDNQFIVDAIKQEINSLSRP